MTQTVAATCVLGPSLTGLAIGVTVLNVDGTEYAAFSTTGVAETSVAGTYRKAGGVVCPDAGGYLVWGVSGTDYAEATVDPKPAQAGDEMDLVDAPNATAVTAIQNGLAQVTDVEGVGSLVSSRAAQETSNQILAGLMSAQQVRDSMMLAPTAGAPATGSIDDLLADLASNIGPGSSTGYYSDTVTDGTDPLDGVRVQLYTGASMTGLAYEAYTNALGVFEMNPDPGTYYVFFDLAGYSFTQGASVEVTEP